MRVAIVTGGMPSRGTSGDSLVMRTLAERLRILGHETSVLVLLAPADIEEGSLWIDQAERELCELGVRVHRLVTPQPDPADAVLSTFPYGMLAADVVEVLADERPDVVLGFDTG